MIKFILFLNKLLHIAIKKYFVKKLAKKQRQEKYNSKYQSHNPTPKQSLYAEDILYDTQQVYILYSVTQNNFKYCMHNKLLKRQNILEFKFMLNKFVNQNEFVHEKFENDAHEIYRKLKSKSISKKNMLSLNEFLLPFITREIPQQIESLSSQKYGNLIVVK